MARPFSLRKFSNAASSKAQKPFRVSTAVGLSLIHISLKPVAETMPGKLPQRKLVTTAAAGYSSDGNQIGLATGQVDEIYHPGYAAKRMERCV